MDIKSFAVGMLVASVICIATISSAEVFCDKSIIRECNLIEDGPIDTDFEQVMVNNRVEAYERGYYTCLGDVYPQMHDAYLLGRERMDAGDTSIDQIANDLSLKFKFNWQDNEYLYTLLTN